MFVPARATALGFAMALSISSMAVADGGECGPFEDARRTSYRKLAWSDFQGPRPARSSTYPPLVALIVTSVRVERLQVVSSEQPDGGWAARAGAFCVRAYMHKDRSEYLSEVGQMGDLAHEQGHFDIAQLCANDFAAELAQLEARAADGAAAEQALRASARALYQRAAAQCAKTQERYERETSYGNRRGPQQKWRAELTARIAAAGREGALVALASGAR